MKNKKDNFTKCKKITPFTWLSPMLFLIDFFTFAKNYLYTYLGFFSSVIPPVLMIYVASASGNDGES